MRVVPHGYSRPVKVWKSATGPASSAAGQVLRAATAAATARPSDKPLHPRGVVELGTLHRTGAVERTGAPWLDERGEERVLVRQSRAVGLPAPFPDVFGLAIRVLSPDGPPVDVLFASTGLGRLTRYTLTAGRSPHHRPMTTLLPYRSAAGAVLVSAVFRSETEVALAWATGSRAWNPFAELVLDPAPPGESGDQLVSFDPVRNTPPGLDTYDWVRRLRDPAYQTARRSRRS